MLLLTIDITGHLTIGDLIVGGGTIALAVFALIQIAIERGARKKQELRAQAERVSGWPHSYWGDSTQTVVSLHNGSDEPVYRAIVSFVFFQGAAPHSGKELVANWQQFGQFVRTFTVIPPGQHYTTVPGGWAGMMRRPSVELAFVDRAGVSWLRTGDGRLSKIRGEPADYYGLPQPISWDIPLNAVPEPKPEADPSEGETTTQADTRRNPGVARRIRTMLRRLPSAPHS